MSKSYSAETIAAARRYFNDAEPRFWTWGDDAITWPDGTTIVFYRELADLFLRLALDGLPRFTPLLLLLAASRENYRREHIFWELWQERGLLRDATAPNCPDPNELCAGLDRIASLPQELRSNIAAKAALIETVFAGQRHLAAEDALNVLELLRTMPPRELFNEAVRDSGFGDAWPEQNDHAHVWKKEELLGKSGRTRATVTLALMSMRAALNRIDDDALRLRQRTGLDQMVQPAEIEPAPDESLRAFISRLRDDTELSGLGRLAHDLMAAVQVPRSVSDPEDLSLGGVTDISNRGPLDRLLTSELAHDDLTLAVRVAVGEALYLRREAPPRRPVRERYVLIDCGIRLWGVPRVFAAAVGLALAATVDQHTKAAAWRATADGIEPVDLRTREGLIALVEQLEATPQPVAALAKFFDAVDQTATAADAILVTHEDVLDDADFRRGLDDLGHRQFYIASIDRAGRFRLSSHSGRGTRLVREARFDLDRLLSPPRHSAPLIRRDTGSDLPAILAVEPFPLLLPHEVRSDGFSFHPKFGAITLTHDGRLMHWAKKGCAAAQVTAAVPRGTVRHLSTDDEGVVRLVVGGTASRPLQLLRANVAQGDVQILNVNSDVKEPFQVIRDDLNVYLVNKRSICAITDEGDVTPEVECRFRYAGQRFFVRGVWYALSFDGQSPRLTQVPIHNSIALGSIATMFDIKGREGPWVVTDLGQVISTIDGSVLASASALTGAVSVVAISHEGHRVILDEHNRPQTFHRLHLDPAFPPNSEYWPAELPKWKGVYPESAAYIHSRSMSWRYFLICADHDGRLALTSRRGEVWRFDVEPRQTRLWMLCQTSPPPRRVADFRPAASPARARFRLRLARWTDGSRAWLDSRGLLHLKSSDRGRPELTIVLAQNAEVAAWASDGRIWGPTYYTGIEREEARPGEELLAEIEAFVARLR